MNLEMRSLEQRKIVQTAMDQFSANLGPNLIRGILLGRLKLHPRISQFDWQNQHIVDTQNAQKALPWLDFRNLLGEAQAMNDIQFWEALIRSTPQSTREELLRVLGKKWAHGVAARIHEANKSFFVPSTQRMLLAAVLGNELQDPITHAYDGKNAIANPAMHAVKKLFLHKVSSPEEIYARLTELFPPRGEAAGHHPGHTSAIHGLRQHDAFARRFDPQDTTGRFADKDRHCPAVSLTAKIYGAYGNILQTPAYRSSFLERMQVQQNDSGLWRVIIRR